jgi:DNA-directed RNA polymerase II subunit RPB1
MVRVLTSIFQSEDLRHALSVRDRKRRFEMIWRLSKPKLICEADPPADDEDQPVKEKSGPQSRHGGCGNAQPEIRKSGLELWASWKARKGEDEEDTTPEKRRIFPQEALGILKILSDETLEILGMNLDFARPEWMILSALPVPPPPVRPSISVDGSGQGQRGEDDLTFKLADILRANGQVKRSEVDGTPDHIRIDHCDLLQYHIATYMDNNIASIPPAQHKSGRPIKSIRARLKGKEGRLRQNLMGKRVDFSARTVITGDPNLSLDEVGVPRSIARNLTYPEMVTPYNMDHLKKLVANGPNNHPGARYVIRENGERLDLKYHKRAGEISLQYGWKVERHIVDGDVILFNRQPSLHKESMMAHRVRVMPYSTFRLNLSVTTPYNADFDGDEMNLHVPQSEESRAELANLCMVPLNIVSPQRNSPLMGIVQDTLCGIYKICRRDTFLSREEVMNIMLWVPDWDGVIPQPAIVKPRPRWTGKQIISMALPHALNLERTEGKDEVDRWCPLTDGGLLVADGQLMFGLFNKKQVGTSAGGIIHTIFNEFGHETAILSLIKVPLRKFNTKSISRRKKLRKSPLVLTRRS